MKEIPSATRPHERWAHFRFSVIGPLLAAPPERGQLQELWLRFASWDLSTVYLADRKAGAILCRIYPVDKKKNAEGLRAPRAGAASPPPPLSSPGIAPLLQKIIQQYAATGLPPAYLPQSQNPQNPS